jgi:hypothetical protein
MAIQDLDLERRLTNYLLLREVPACDSVQLVVHGGVVVLNGVLPSEYDKWICVECCRRVAGVIRIMDRLQVRSAAMVSQTKLASPLSDGKQRRGPRRRQVSTANFGRPFTPEVASEPVSVDIAAFRRPERVPVAA